MSENVAHNANGKMIVKAFKEWAASHQQEWNATQLTNFAQLEVFLGMIIDYGAHTEICRQLSEFLISPDPAAFSKEFKERLDKLMSQSLADPAMTLLKEFNVSNDERMQYILWRRDYWEIKSA